MLHISFLLAPNASSTARLPICHIPRLLRVPAFEFCCPQRGGLGCEQIKSEENRGFIPAAAGQKDFIQKQHNALRRLLWYLAARLVGSWIIQ